MGRAVAHEWRPSQSAFAQHEAVRVRHVGSTSAAAVLRRWTRSAAGESIEQVRQEPPMEPVLFNRDAGLDALRRLRAELRESMAALEQALAAPAPGRVPGWAERVEVALVELSADLREHVAITEGPDGLHGDVLAMVPRLSKWVERLVRDHVVIADVVADLLGRVSRPVSDDSVDAIRVLGTTLLGRLARHRQRGADLIYEAYHVDLGGET